ncbi:MAG: methyltransferase domain-containing protein [Vicinamibacterales bacterium]
MRVRTGVVVGVLAGLLTALLIEEAVRTLRILEAVERDRDRWQRPEQVLAALDLHAGQRVVDLGAGAGYFSLKIAPRVQPGGEVLAVDLRRESLAFLWIRAQLRRARSVHPIVGAEDDPRLPAGAIDGVLIANTFHELTEPGAILTRLFAMMRPGGRLVIVERGRRAESDADRGHHQSSADDVARAVAGVGFRKQLRDDAFIEPPGDDVWWLLTFVRP